MKVVKPGHVYDLDNLHGNSSTRLQFYMDPELHDGESRAGPNCQEVIRALIDRVNYLDSEKPWEGNEAIVMHLRSALALFESRAILRKIERGELDIENVMLGKDGHIVLTK